MHMAILSSPPSGSLLQYYDTVSLLIGLAALFNSAAWGGWVRYKTCYLGTKHVIGLGTKHVILGILSSTFLRY